MSRPRVALVILSYNRADLLAECLDAVKARTDLDGVEVVVVDNASKDGSAAMVRERFPWVRLVQSEANRGFAGGVNLGMVTVPAGAYALLNSDALVTDGWLARLESTLAATGDGIVGGLELDPAGQTRFGGDETSRPKAQRVPVPSDTVSFACALISHRVVERIGYLDHGYFMYHEDWDYCHRARAAGFPVVFDPAVEILHGGEASFKTQTSAWRTRVRTASRLRYQLIHWPAGRIARSLLREPLLFGYWLKEGTPGPYLKGVWETVRSAGDIRRRRRDLTGFVPPK